MDPTAALRLALDPAGILKAQALQPDPWQRELLASASNQILLNCSRQSGKSTVVAAKALHTAIFKPHIAIPMAKRDNHNPKCRLTTTTTPLAP